MKSEILPHGLSKRTTRCLGNAGIPIEKEWIARALKSGRIQPFCWPPNYGIITHKEVCGWAGLEWKSLSPPPPYEGPMLDLDNGLSYRANRCLCRSGIPATKRQVRDALQSGALKPGKHPSNYRPKTHDELCRWAGVDPKRLGSTGAPPASSVA